MDFFELYGVAKIKPLGYTVKFTTREPRAILRSLQNFTNVRNFQMMLQHGQEKVNFDDVSNEIFDMCRPNEPDRIEI